MKKLVTLLLLLSGSAFAGDNTTTTDIANEAGAVSNSSTIIMGTQPSPTIGFPGLPGSLPPQLLNQQQPPPYVLYSRLLELTSQFGDIVITGKGQLTQQTTEGNNFTVTFAPSPQFIRHKKESSAFGGQKALSATFSFRFSDTVKWLGTVLLSSKNGIVLIPSAGMQVVRDALEAASGPTLTEVVIVPVPHGYGVNVGVTSEGSAGGISSSLAKITSLFLGVGPSWSSQNGTTMPTGTWSQQYIVLERDPNGIPFSIDMVIPPIQPKVATLPVESQVNQVAAARVVAVAQAQSLADALMKARLALTVTIPTDRVITERVPCKTEEFVDTKGNVVHMCRGPTNGSYGATKVIRETATGQSTIDYGSLKK